MFNTHWELRPHCVKRRQQRASAAKHVIQTLDHAPIRPRLAGDFQQAFKGLAFQSWPHEHADSAVSERCGAAYSSMAMDEKPWITALQMPPDKREDRTQGFCKMPGGVLALLIMEEEDMVAAVFDSGVRRLGQVRIKQRHNQPRPPLRRSGFRPREASHLYQFCDL
jgi:hypothetical protein